MPTLKDPRQEMFAQHLATGKGTPESYVLAGYQRKDLSSQPWRTKALPRVRARVRELQEQYAADHGVSVGVILAELEAARENAKAQGNPGAEVAAVMGKAKLLGMLVDKTEDVTQRKPALLPTKKTEMTESEWRKMVGLPAANGAGNGRVH